MTCYINGPGPLISSANTLGSIMNNVVTMCALVATAFYFAEAYDFQDSDFNQFLAADLDDALDSLDSTPLHSRVRRDEEADLEEKCRKRHRRPRFCCADETMSMIQEKDKEIVRGCFKDVLGVDKNSHHKRGDPFSCEEIEKRKNDMICIQQCYGQKKGLLGEDGYPIPENISKILKESFVKESWLDAAREKIVSNCLSEAKNATKQQQVKPNNSSDVKVCKLAGITLKHCIFREVQLSCPADQIKDKTFCDKFQERIKKGHDFFGPPPPPPGPGSF